MKFLLAAINAKYIHSNPAVYSLRAYAGQRYAEDIEIAEYTINNRLESILADVYSREPDVAAFSCYIWNWRLVRELVGELHKLRPALPLWLGGPEVSFNPEEILGELPMLTGIMAGEGEQTFLELLKYYKKEPERTDLAEIKGIAYRSGKAVLRTGERELTDINDIPFPYQELDSFQNRIIYYESSRGCPFRCSYCLSSIDKSVRLRDGEKVRQELEFFLQKRVSQVKFIDRTFNCSHEHAMSIWSYILEHDNGVTNFHFEVAADIMKEEEIELLARLRPGLVQLEIGVQSANTAALKEINRHTDIDRLAEIVQRLREKKNIHIHLDLIAGLPYEDYHSFGESFNTVYRMRPEQLQLGFLKLLKGSPMHERVGRYGINYTSHPPYEVLYSDWIGYGELCRLKKVEEMVEMYYNSSQFTHTLPMLEKAFEAPFAMFERLAEYYEKNGLLANQPSRTYRYQVLLAFACEYDSEHEELYKELLSYDIYLRENMKSRPAFAPNREPYKEAIRKFYHQEQLCELLPSYRDYQPAQIARMTHAEIFTYPVWEESHQSFPNRLGEAKLIIFDYSQRNPLTHEARKHIINITNLP